MSVVRAALLLSLTVLARLANRASYVTKSKPHPPTVRPLSVSSLHHPQRTCSAYIRATSHARLRHDPLLTWWPAQKNGIDSAQYSVAAVMAKVCDA
jgi:hypothetical protein